MSIDQLRKFIGTFKTESGVFWLDPKSGLLTINGANSTPALCTPGQTTPCFDIPAPGQFGNVPFLGFEGPKFFNQDLSVVKRTSVPAISENFNFEIRLEAFNVFNHPSFQTPFALDNSNNPLTANMQSTQFGKLTDIVDTVRGGGINSRVVQWAIRVNF